MVALWTSILEQKPVRATTELSLLLSPIFVQLSSIECTPVYSDATTGNAAINGRSLYWYCEGKMPPELRQIRQLYYLPSVCTLPQTNHALDTRMPENAVHHRIVALWPLSLHANPL